LVWVRFPQRYRSQRGAAVRALGNRGEGRDREVDEHCRLQGVLEGGTQETVGSVYGTGGVKKLYRGLYNLDPG
jgi:hypothetical protein